ncbi:MAG TPA: helix-turn-helix transcriptional regulator [Thermoanaerobaculia bacterium]
MTYRDQIRRARLAARLTYSDVQRLTGIRRDHYRKFEEGGDLGADRLEKVLSVIPNLPPLHIGTATVAANRSELAEMHAGLSALCATIDMLQAAAHQMLKGVEQRLGAPAVVEGRDPDLDPELIRELTEEAMRGRKSSGRAGAAAGRDVTTARRRVKSQ